MYLYVYVLYSKADIYISIHMDFFRNNNLILYTSVRLDFCTIVTNTLSEYYMLYTWIILEFERWGVVFFSIHCDIINFWGLLQCVRYFLRREALEVTNVQGRSFESHSYLICVTAANQCFDLSNMNVIFKNYPNFSFQTYLLIPLWNVHITSLFQMFAELRDYERMKRVWETDRAVVSDGFPR